MTSIDIRNPSTVNEALAELPPLPIAALMIGIYNLLQEGADLPQPQYVSVSETSQHIDMLFPGEQASLRAITHWAHRFGGVVASKPHNSERGPRTYCVAAFGYYGLAVEAYAFIPAQTAST
jgi:hypothetical protein